MAKDAKARLGRGLSALIGEREPLRSVDAEEGAVDAPAGVRAAPIERLKPNPNQPRRHFDETALAELAVSLRDKGMLQPILVREAAGPEETYEIIAGERRWRAAQLANLHEVPIIIRDLTDVEVVEISIIENVQRTDLNPIEEGGGYRTLADAHGYTQEQIAAAVGKSRSHIANLMRLLDLPEPVQAALRDGRLSMGHARALLSAADPVALAEEIAAKGLSVRAVEARVKAERAPESLPAAPKARPAPSAEPKDADTRALEDDLARALGLAVSIEHKGEAGQVRIAYGTLEQLDEICRRLCQT